MAAASRILSCLILISISLTPLAAERLTYLRVIATEGTPERIVHDLASTQFQVLENGKVRPIAYFSDKPTPMSLVVLVDVSGSMLSFPDLSETLEKIRALPFANGEMMVVSFTDECQVLRDFGRAIQEDEGTPADANRDSRRRTSLFDALILAAERLEGSSSFANRVIVVLTDGEDNSSQYRFQETRDRLETSGARLYYLRGKSDLASGRSTLESLAKVTGGFGLRLWDRVATRPLQEAIDLFLLLQQSEYVLGFESVAGRPPSRESLKVKALRKGVKLRFTVSRPSPEAGGFHPSDGKR